MAAALAPEPVVGVVQYLQRDSKHDTEKPYYLYYDYDYDIPRTNTAPDDRPVTIENARDLDISSQQLFFDRGFTKLPISCRLRPEEYSDANIKDVLYPEYEALVRSLYPDAARVEVLEHGVRRRDAEWLKGARERHEFQSNQPSDYSHIDMTGSSAAKCAIKRFGIQPDQYRRFVVVNIWKPIRGPVYDWPLTLCDRRTVDHAQQTVAMDIVAQNYVNENTRIYYDKAHRWYYWHGLLETEAILFMQHDSDADDRAGVPHTSFKDTRLAADIAPRESVEARVFVYFD